MLNGATFLRRELMIRVVRAFDAGTLADDIDRIAVHLRPKNGDSSRCCIYHDRAVIKYRLMALLGVSVEEEKDEMKRLVDYLAEKESGAVPEHGENPLSVCGPACSGCPDAKVVSTTNCRGCFARPCVYNCPKKAIEVVDGHSVIDQSKCIKCGKCITACPYHAIVKTTVPCEEACPVGAIRKNEHGVAEIDFKRCIFCGKCFNACPFSAVMERSQLVDLLIAMKRGEKLVAMVAPSADRQFPGTIEQLLTACSKAGFSDVMEVALGAEKTTEHETAEFIERMEKNQKTFMTTSCCPAWVNLVGKHLPELVDHVSLTPSPMVYAREIVKAKYPDAKTVFIGPCVAKRSEARRKDVDYVLSFEELGALFAGRKIDVIACDPWPVERPANPTARNYARSCGVTDAVLAEATTKIPGFKLDSKQINGIDRKTCAMVKLYAAGKLPVNFLEVMACPGGCQNGPCSLT
ncbi:MAG: 4Fe-4S dicluster domain-containing protein [Lentisphaerae bacterium]|nr:4Fe-4S dicluster domain-containing protein [Lentisphaerota bacterium]